MNCHGWKQGLCGGEIHKAEQYVKNKINPCWQPRTAQSNGVGKAAWGPTELQHHRCRAASDGYATALSIPRSAQAPGLGAGLHFFFSADPVAGGSLGTTAPHEAGLFRMRFVAFGSAL